MQTQNSSHVRLGALALGISAFLFAAFPLVRPFFPNPDVSSPASFTVAFQALASSAWVVSHLIAIIAFALLPFGLLALFARLAERRTLWAMVLSVVGIALLLSVAGTETYALPVIGKLYLEGKTEVAPMVDLIRRGPAGAVLFLGLLLLAIGTIWLAIFIWRSDVLPKWAGVAFAIGLALWFPLFPQMIRIADGLLIGVGGLWLAWSIWQKA